ALEAHVELRLEIRLAVVLPRSVERHRPRVRAGDVQDVPLLTEERLAAQPRPRHPAELAAVLADDRALDQREGRRARQHRRLVADATPRRRLALEAQQDSVIQLTNSSPRAGSAAGSSSGCPSGADPTSAAP